MPDIRTSVLLPPPSEKMKPTLDRKHQPGDVLQVSGEAHIMWEEDEGVSGINAGATTGKHIRIDVLSVVEAKGANPLRMKMKELSPFNPPLPVPPELSGDGFGDGAERQQRQTEDNHLMRCSEVLDVAAGVKSFRFQPSTASGGGGDTEKLLAWTPGQASFVFFVFKWRACIGLVFWERRRSASFVGRVRVISAASRLVVLFVDGGLSSGFFFHIQKKTLLKDKRANRSGACDACHGTRGDTEANKVIALIVG